MTLNWTDLEPLCDIESPHSAGFAVALDVCRASFESDVAAIQNIGRDLLFSAEYSNQADWGQRVAGMFMAWRHDVPPTMPALLSLACDYFDIADDHPLLKVALTACILAEIPHLNAYHNNHHFHEVVAITMRLCATHQQTNKVDDIAFNVDDILLLITAAAIHDFDHDGRGNIVDGHHIPSRLERRALAQSKPFLMEAGLTDSQFETVHTIVLTTDVSRGQDGKSPANVLRDIYQAYMNHDTSMPEVPDLLLLPTRNYKVALMACLLGEADIAPSTGLSYDFSQMATVLVAEESSVLQPSATTLHGFMRHICHGQYMSDAARILMAENFTSISLMAEQDSEENKLYA